ncbi:60S acidic ribosomal protein P3-2 [Dioscorea cayenensis subsp. rotundata]|uniref:60S acidic ribosomal protein P3-2 n=1 Tax=Dioscorea cayennensis subsp. rotundata TaxID=55577 RepID=A0AB40B191_DIOCR|nr:60S acidic ribosomal protein P3-2 [Dioscorea cayenensis subsp. rotundata]
MGVFTFVCRKSGSEWSASQLSGDLEGSASSTFDLQRNLVKTVLGVDSSGGVQSSFSLVTPSSAVFQVIVGGGGGGGFIASGGAAAAGAGGGAAAAAPEAPPAEEKKEEKEESDDDMGFSLFD